METGPDISGTQLLENGALTALVRKPPATGKAVPVLLMLHGFGANESDIYELVPFVDRRVLVVAVRAPGKVDDNPRGSYKWYDRVEPQKPLPGLLDDSLARLRQLIGQLEQLTGLAVDSKQIYMGGFSQGASMSLTMAANYPQLLAGILPHSGFVSAPAAEKLRAGAFSGKAAFLAHGIYDEVLRVELGREAKKVLEEGGVDVSYREYPIAHATSPDSRQAFADWLNSHLKF